MEISTFTLTVLVNQIRQNSYDSVNVLNLKQSVNQPTRKLGHILDWFLSRPDDNILQSTLVSHELASDHLCNVCHLDVSVLNPPPLFATKRILFYFYFYTVDLQRGCIMQIYCAGVNQSARIKNWYCSIPALFINKN